MSSRSIVNLITFCLLVSAFPSIAQKKQTLSSPHKKEIDAYIKAEMKAEQIPGLSYAVVSNGKIIESGAYGWANAELKAPVTSHTLFNIGSIGKTFTATAIMLLQKDGKLSINDPISKYLDSLPDSWSKITIRHLLSHTSGIRDYTPDFPGYPLIPVDRKQEITEAKYIQMAAEQPLNFQPGERWAYSNSNFVLLGFIIHKLAGKPTGDFITERIFGPAGMTETRYTNVRNIIPGRATGYLLDENNKLINGKYISNFFSTMGDMGILTTATDLVKWSMALDDEKVLDKKTLEQMWTPSKLNNGIEANAGIFGVNYGLGWVLIDHRGNKKIGHGGSFANGYEADLSRFPEKHFAVVVLTNLNPSNVGWISNNIAGFYFPELKGIDQLKPEANEDSSLRKNVHALLDGLAKDNLDTSLVTFGYKQRIDAITWRVFLNEWDSKSLLYFVHSDLITRNNFVRNDAPVKKIDYYAISLRNETHYLAIYFTANNKIADTRLY